MFSIQTLIRLFPIVFILHDFEELILFEPWLKRNGPDIIARLQPHAPAFFLRQVQAILRKTTPQFALPIFLIFLLTCLASFLALLGHPAFFYAAAALYFLHGFMHLGQAILLRRYVPSVLTSLLVAIPYGLLLFFRLLLTGLLSWPQLAFYFALAILLGVPFILLMHIVGERVYARLPL